MTYVARNLLACAVFATFAAPATSAETASPRPTGIAQAGSRDALFGDDVTKPTTGTRSGSKNDLFGDDVPTKKPSPRDTLFGDESPKPAAESPRPGSKGELSGSGTAPSDAKKAPSRDSLFGDDVPAEKPDRAAAAASKLAADPATGWRGYVQTEVANTYETPDHWSKARVRLELGRQGRISDTVKFKVTGRFDYDAVFDLESNFYPAEVKHDQRRNFEFRETYLDVSAGDWEFRLGRQHVIWGEVPGLFFADVVSSKDLREFVLPEFDSLRIPQWAARAEYFAGNAHLEFLWIPWVTVDRIGKPGTDFYPYPPPPPPGFNAFFAEEQKPTRTLRNSNYGMRVSTLADGWDLSGFAYRAIDTEANFYRDVIAGPAPAFVFRPRHDRITQFGGTLSKDLGDFVLKAEAIYTKDKGFSVQRLAHADGIVKQDMIDYLLGVDFSLGTDTRVYTYGFQRRILNHDADIVPDRVETGATVQLTHKVTSSLELQALMITSLNRNDWMFRPKVVWNFAKNWRLNAGLDVMHGPMLGFFGRFADKDRIYADVRYSF